MLSFCLFPTPFFNIENDKHKHPHPHPHTNRYVIKFPNAPQGVEVDVVGYKTKEEKAYELDLDAGLLEVGELDAVAVVPKHNPTFHGIHTINKTNFLEMGQLAGAATTL